MTGYHLDEWLEWMEQAARGDVLGQPREVQELLWAFFWRLYSGIRLLESEHWLLEHYGSLD